jgi:hydroxylysine kinase
VDGLSAVAAAPPPCSTEHVADAVAAQFGKQGRLERLVSERDLNYCLTTSTGERFLVKVTSALESEDATALQVDVLLHLEHNGAVATPGVIRTCDGAAWARIESAAGTHRLRLLSWVEGEQLESLQLDADIASRFGAALAELDEALSDYAFRGENPVLIWDLQRVCELRPLLRRIDDRAVREAAATAIDDYEDEVVPGLEELRLQLIHADANPENVLSRDGKIGFIDFSDMVRAPRVFDAAIAAAYLRPGGNDPLEFIRPFFAGYQSVAPLDSAEKNAVFDLVRARLATSITLLHWRLDERPAGDEYGQKSQALESSASHFLAALNRVGRNRFTKKINNL